MSIKLNDLPLGDLKGIGLEVIRLSSHRHLPLGS